MLCLNYELIWFSMWPPRSSHWLYPYIYISDCVTSDIWMPFPPSIQRIIPKGPCKLFWSPKSTMSMDCSSRIPGNQWFFWGPEIPIYAWHCRWDSQLPFGGKVLHIISVSQGKRMKNRKDSHDLIPNKNLASIATFLKVGILMINRVISQKHHNRNPTKITRVFTIPCPPIMNQAMKGGPFVAAKHLP